MRALSDDYANDRIVATIEADADGAAMVAIADDGASGIGKIAGGRETNNRTEEQNKVSDI